MFLKKFACAFSFAVTATACSTVHQDASTPNSGGNSVGSGPTIRCLPLDRLVCPDGQVPNACPSSGFHCIQADDPANSHTAGATTLEPRVAKLLFNALSVDAVPSGGGLVMKKTEQVTCALATIAAPGRPPTTNYSCLGLGQAEAKDVYNFLTGPATSAGAGGGLAMNKTGTVECVYARTSGPRKTGSAAAEIETYSCSNIVSP